MVLPSLLIQRGQVYREPAVQSDRDEAVTDEDSGVEQGCAAYCEQTDFEGQGYRINQANF